MKKNNPPTPQSIKLPPIHFFPLQRAAEVTGCTTDDILQMAYTGAIDLCVLVRDCQAIVSLSGDLSAWKGDHERAFSEIIPSHNEFLEVRRRCDGEFFIKQPSIEAPKTIGDRVLTEDERIRYAKGMELAISSHVMEFSCDISGFWLLKRHVSMWLFIDKRVDCPMPLRPIFNLPHNISLTVTPAHKVNDDGNVSLSAKALNMSSDDVFITREGIKKIIDAITQDKPMAIDSGSDTKEISDGEVPHHNAERFATNREALLAAAIFILSKYPDECRGVKKEISPERWRAALQDHLNEVPPLLINNAEVIEQKLRNAVNLNWQSNHTVGV